MFLIRLKWSSLGSIVSACNREPVKVECYVVSPIVGTTSSEEGHSYGSLASCHFLE